MQIASQNAPSPKVVVPHFVLGGMSWLAATILIILSPEAFTRHYFNPQLLSITHLLVLGWITMMILGALYQLIPVIMEVKLYSEKLALGSLILFFPGAILLSYAFWQFNLGVLMHISATLVITAVLLFAINVFITAKKSQKETVERDFILTSVIWLVFTVLAGLTLALNLSNPFLKPEHIQLLKLHSHAGMAGWFIQLVIGVSSRLLPMFIVAHNLNFKKLRIAYYLLNGALILGLTGLFAGHEIAVVISIFIFISGLAFFFSFLFQAFRTRVKKAVDIGMKQSLLSFIILIIPLILLIVLSLDLLSEPLSLKLSVAYGTALILGFFSSLIMGQTYKTLPFIIWLKIYRSRVGKGKTPLPKDLYSEKAAVIQLWLFASGFITLLSGIIISEAFIVSIGGVILFCATLFYNFNIFKIILHKPINYE